MKIIEKTKAKKVLKPVLVFMIFFIGMCSIAAVDTICEETTGHGGKLVFDVEKAGSFN